MTNLDLGGERNCDPAAPKEASQEAAAAVVHLANQAEGAVGESASVTPQADQSTTWTGPRNFRDHTNPYTMTMPASWGSNRRT